jgi:protein-tyrosine phosphatase
MVKGSIERMKTVMNFREVGGFPSDNGKMMKRGMLFRSGSLDKARGNDLQRIRSLRIKTIIDLRSKPEYRSKTGAPLEVRKVTLPLNFDGIVKARLQPYLRKKGVEQQIINVLDGVYSDMVDWVLPEVGELFRVLLMEDPFPLLVNCRAGKDRTGFVYAVIELALGVETEYIIQDYLRSNDSVVPKARRILKLLKIITLGWFPAGNIQLAFTAQEKYIRTIIDKINQEYGGIVCYLERCGVSGNDLRRLREMLLDAY